MSIKKIAIFASGSGSNALKIIQYFKDRADISVAIILTNKSSAGVLDKAKKYKIPTSVFDRSMFYQTDEILNTLIDIDIELIVLAGFLWKVPSNILQKYNNKIINIHPALLPKYGGKGMYGQHVHQAVKAAGESVSGITIHYVNEYYDEGNIIIQAHCQLLKTDSPQDIATKVLRLEHHYYPVVIDSILSKQR